MAVQCRADIKTLATAVGTFPSTFKFWKFQRVGHFFRATHGAGGWHPWCGFNIVRADLGLPPPPSS